MIILLILITFSFDDILILFGEHYLWSLLGLNGFVARLGLRPLKPFPLFSSPFPISLNERKSLPPPPPPPPPPPSCSHHVLPGGGRFLFKIPETCKLVPLGCDHVSCQSPRCFLQKDFVSSLATSLVHQHSLFCFAEPPLCTS